MSRHATVLAACCSAVIVLTTVSVPVARAQATPDPLQVRAVASGYTKARITVTAGASGAPNGFEVCWMTAALFANYGNTWPAPWVAGEGWDDFVGVGTLHTWGAPSVDFKLAPNQSLDLEIGGTYDESGVSGTRTTELIDGTSYVLCAYAIGAGGGSASPLSVTLAQTTTTQGSNCSYTQGYWKNHASAWPVSSLTLGTVSYTKAQLLQILGQSVGGNGLISLAHQLIAAKLNIAFGADGSSILAVISAADALIGSRVVPPVGTGSLSTSSTSGANQSLDDFNNGLSGPGHCSTPARTSTWGALKTLYR